MKKKKSRTEVFLINMKYYGEEPTFSEGHLLTENELGSCLNWFSGMEDQKDSEEYVIEYLQNTKDSRLEKFKAVKIFPITLGWLARLWNNGYQLPPSCEENFNKWLDECIQKIQKDDEPSTIVNTLSKKKDIVYINVLEEVDAIIFDKRFSDNYSLYNFLTISKPSKSDIDAIKKLVEEYYIEYSLVYAAKDPQINEGYRHYTKAQKKEVFQFIQKLKNDLDRFIGNNKKSRKPRKKKILTADRILKNFQYCVEDLNDQLKSISPEKILTSEEVWLFNTKYKMITVLCAEAGKKLTVRNSFIENIDPEKSMSKRIGWKYKEHLSRILQGTRASNKRYLNEINASNLKAINRTTTDVVILRNH